MKLSLKCLLVISTIALASQSSVVLAEQAAVTSDSDAGDAAEAKVEDAVEAAVDGDGDAGKECAADGSCAPEEAAAVEEDPKCPSRPHVIRCAAKYLDTNHNGALDREELDTAMGSVSWILRGLLKVIGSVDAIMKKCDADGDGKITIEQDMEATKETCLATCFKRKAFKGLFFPDCTE
mmetsp:Transcript_11433/g.21140  ORF Transcript_11433/g.21140 Transcript_11433/m.21140 type:complete len:179 (-) Transcript_11433:353-889(-)|eukprot:CAMPEP_0201868238 /NCGR_PEP_ID=MMETSP0902-20130614/2209_1 /ASSEMBLY_ACC=CAM_ASM_000551 /TAXON_ID=420261 /ORGANISM="Thalassiosira antarctica, Strain CCMP982" /LENGTH=178 /DNA_ID=CAMNT_0048393557 /DNA_START=64 /DNA_END=600 /DNA_ORIENTATION=+